MGSVLDSILNPAADKALMTTLFVTLAVRESILCASAYIQSLRPPYSPFCSVDSTVPLGVFMLGRDVSLSLSAS